MPPEKEDEHISLFPVNRKLKLRSNISYQLVYLLLPRGPRLKFVLVIVLPRVISVEEMYAVRVATISLARYKDRFDQVLFHGLGVILPTLKLGVLPKFLRGECNKVPRVRYILYFSPQKRKKGNLKQNVSLRCIGAPVLSRCFEFRLRFQGRF